MVEFRLTLKLSEPAGYCTYHQVLHSKILHADYIEFMCFVWFSEQRVTFVLYVINRLVFITEVESVYSAVRTEFLYNTILIIKTTRCTNFSNLYLE